jgi:hypothetical protein
MIDTPFSIPLNTSPCEENGSESSSKMFYELHIGRDRDHSSIQNPSRSLISFVCAYGLLSSIQTTGFQVRRPRWLLQNVDLVAILMSCWKNHLWSSFSLLAEVNRFWAEMSWYWVKFMLPLVCVVKELFIPAHERMSACIPVVLSSLLHKVCCGLSQHPQISDGSWG